MCTDCLALSQTVKKKAQTKDFAHKVTLVACTEMMAVSHVSHGIKTSGRNGERCAPS